MDNVVADCLSRQVNAIEEGPGEPEPFALRYLRNLAETGPEWTLGRRPPSVTVREADREGREAIRQEEERVVTTARDSPREMEIEDTIINDKRRQLIVTLLEGDGVGTRAKRYKHISTVWIAVGRTADEVDILSTLNQVIEPGKIYHVFVANGILRDRLREWYQQGRLAAEATIGLCTKRVETIENEQRQAEIVGEYHTGKTNHRGVSETLVHLKRTYYWVDMPGTVRRVIGVCPTCNLAKYERSPATSPQIVSETPKTPLAVVQADLLFWNNTKILTILDITTKFLFTRCLTRKTGAVVRDALLTYFGLVGTPQKLIVDPGREFKNETVQRLLDEFEVQVHFTTPGHPHSHGAIERVHNTLTEHLHIIEIEKKITGQEATARATLAYNYTIHSTTGRTPIELMREWQRENTDISIIQEREQIAIKEERQKRERINKGNQVREYLKPRDIRVGQQVFIKNLTKRCKTDPPFCGPFLVQKLLNRHRVQLRRVTGTNARTIIRHLDEVRIRRRGKV